MHRFAPARLRERRSSLGIPPERLALDLERTAQTVSLWERGRVSPSAQQIAKLADLLQCEPGDFYEVQL